MNKIKDWFEVEHDVNATYQRVINVFYPWYKRNLVVTHGKDVTVDLTFGFPYTSSSSEGAGVWNCNCEALLKEDLSMRFKGLMLSENLDVIAVFADDNEDLKEIIIGEVKL